MHKKIVLLILCTVNSYLYSQEGIVDYPLNINDNFCIKYFQKKDTLLYGYAYITDDILDSFKVIAHGVKLSKLKWKIYFSNGDYSISKYKKMKNSKWIKKINHHYLLNLENEIKPIGIEKYYQVDGKILIKYRLFSLTYIKWK